MRAVLSALAFGVFLLGGAALCLLVLPLCRAGGRSRRAQERRNRQVIRGAFRAFVAMLQRLRLIEYREPALPLDRPVGPCVVVANHPSLIDVLFILALVPDLVVVVKASWPRRPLLGSIVRACGWIAGPERSAAHPEAEPVEHDGLGEVALVLEHIVDALSAGAPVLVFPEGTRSPPGGLRRFKRGAAEAARRAGVPVWPFVARCDAAVLGRGWFGVPDGVVRASLEPRPPMDPASFADARAMTRALRSAYEGWLGLPATALASSVPVAARRSDDPAA
jgi:1-acyl-sn-glycerol-3-phosphate acyltransferase